MIGQVYWSPFDWAYFLLLGPLAPRSLYYLPLVCLSLELDDWFAAAVDRFSSSALFSIGVFLFLALLMLMVLAVLLKFTIIRWGEVMLLWILATCDGHLMAVLGVGRSMIWPIVFDTHCHLTICWIYWNAILWDSFDKVTQQVLSLRYWTLQSTLTRSHYGHSANFSRALLKLLFTLMYRWENVAVAILK